MISVYSSFAEISIISPGYYSRASRLLAGAKKAVDDYGGRLPDNAKDMQANIPGIGRYSAGAICSIAYGEKVPVVRLVGFSVFRFRGIICFETVGRQCKSTSQSFFSTACASKS